ncbi:MAG: AAA family ATPase [Actinomycetota bacterium]
MALGPDAFALLRAPTRLEDLGLPPGLVEDLFMRRVLTERMTTVGQAAEALSISHPVGDEVAEILRQKNLIEYHGVEGRDYRISLTEQGQRVTSERMLTGSHVARMPVPLADYQTLVGLQRAEIALTREKAKAAFSDMVLEDSLLDQIGPAFLSDGAILFYGPPGTGKTSLAERMSRFYDDKVLIPRFVEVDGQIVSVYDPSLHEADPEPTPDIDPRYVLCRRPLIMVGGELTLQMMDLQYDRVSGLNAAPIQLLANNGILVVDDFGRQTASPDEILNRWIVPLSRGIDYLRPNTGTKFTVPFELKLVISTNIDPYALGDDAFLRRLRNKVFVGPCTEAAFNWILVRAAKRTGMEVTAQSAAYLTAVTRAAIGELRPYVAVDFCDLAVGIAAYHGTASALDPRMIDQVAAVYFVRSESEDGPSLPRTGTDQPLATPPPMPTPPTNPARAEAGRPPHPAPMAAPPGGPTAAQPPVPAQASTQPMPTQPSAPVPTAAAPAATGPGPAGHHG